MTSATEITAPSAPPETTGARKDIYQQVTDIIIKQLEAGTIPWQQSWTDKFSNMRLPQNAVTGNYYRGANIVLLWSETIGKKFASHEWASFKQWQSKKEAVRKGEKGSMIVYTDAFEKEVDGEVKKISFLKYSTVFNRAQLVSYEPEAVPPSEPAKSLVEKIASIEDFIGNTLAVIETHQGEASYHPHLDKIYMPLESAFIDTKQCTATENYYSTLCHELTHWTGHAKRLDRKIKNKFGNHAYAEEELIAELGAAFLSAEFGITTPEKKDHAAYIASWLKVLKDNKQFVISAASEASKAVEYMKDLQPLKL